MCLHVFFRLGMAVKMSQDEWTCCRKLCEVVVALETHADFVLQATWNSNRFDLRKFVKTKIKVQASVGGMGISVKLGRIKD